MKKLKKTLVAVAAIALVGLLTAQEKRETPSPAGVGGVDQGREFTMPRLEAQEFRKQEPIKIEDFDLEIIAEGSLVGHPGDFLLTFKGRGFMLTSLSPRVMLGEELTLESTEVNRDGTELYLLLSREAFGTLGRLSFEKVVVENPGGLQDSPYARAAIAMTPRELIDRERNAQKVVLVYRDSFYVRQRPNGEPAG